MANLNGKGYGKRGSVFEFILPNGTKVKVTSNASREEDAKKAMKLPEGTKLLSATTVYLWNGKPTETYVDYIWAVEGVIPSGQAGVKKLYELGAISEAQAKDILDSDTIQL